jgi:hypothetical protein
VGVKTSTKKPSVEFSLPMSREQAAAIYAQGSEAVIFVLLALAARLGQQAGGRPSATTPSGVVPPYHKPSAKGRKKTPGREGPP